MTSAFDRKQQASLTRKRHGMLNVSNARWLDYQCRVAIDRLIENAPGHVVAFISR
jgi:hypothetical protein